MKPETLRTLMVARTLFDQVKQLSLSEDKHVASAALIILQDALELIVYGCLIEKGVDEKKSIEDLSFDQLLGELKKANVSIPKTGTLKALNKERVIVKHYGQVAEPVTVQNFINAAELATNSVLSQVIGGDLQHVMIHEFLKPGETRKSIELASKSIEEKEYFQALMHIRRALFVEIEKDYVIEGWTDAKEDGTFGILALLTHGGSKAPIHTRNAQWISENVKDPFEYIQLDHERVRLDMLEWGVPTHVFWNLWRLTPPVYRMRGTKKWLVKGELKHIRLGATERNARYCLDSAVTLLVRKQNHSASAKWIDEGFQQRFKVRLQCDSYLFPRASTEGESLRHVEAGRQLDASSLVFGFDGETGFVRVAHFGEEEDDYFVGYLLESDCEIVDTSASD